MNVTVRHNSLLLFHASACLLICGFLFMSFAQTQTVSADDASEAFKEVIDAQMKAKSYRARMTLPTGNETFINTIEFVAPDKMRIVNKSSEMIIVPEGTYIKPAGGEWKKSPVNMSGNIGELRSSGFNDSFLKDSQVRLVGSDTLDGEPMTVYEIIYDSPETKIKSKTLIWVSRSDKLPRKVEVEGEVGKSESGGESKTIIEYTDYNAPIEITAPIQ